MPKVSIVTASYNHENYVRECVQSALDQTYQDFEIIITDDGSSDRTVEVIREFADARIRLDTFIHNKGACTALNNCLKKAHGEYIAVLNSDDAWEPTKLAKQVKYLDEHPEIGAVFTKVTFVDESSRPISRRDYKHFDIFDQKNRTRYDWLNRFFFNGNCLCHPSVLIRKRCCDEVGLYDERMANLPDWDMWVRLCLKHEIHILDENLVRFRIRASEANASGDRLPTHIRGHFEILQILNHYLTITDKQSFVNVFPEAKEYGEVESKYIPYFLSMLALKVEDSAWRLWGLQVLYNFIGKDVIARGLELEYGFGYRDFLNLAAQTDVYNLLLVHSLSQQVGSLSQQLTSLSQERSSLSQERSSLSQQVSSLSQQLTSLNGVLKINFRFLRFVYYQALAFIIRKGIVSKPRNAFKRILHSVKHSLD